jgi:hypothetical protein
MKYGLILIALLTLASLARADQSQQVIDVQHDDHRDATCWIIPGTGISCLPDNQLRQPNPPPKRAQSGANPASAPAPRRTLEAYQL